MFEQVRDFIAKKIECDPKTIEGDTELISLGIDSLQLLMIINDFEEAFNISISDSELETIHTVNDIVKIIENNHE